MSLSWSILYFYDPDMEGEIPTILPNYMQCDKGALDKSNIEQAKN